MQTKILLKSLSPEEILIDRFLLAWLFFWIIKPTIMFGSFKEEFLFFWLGATGIFGYYIMENIALKYTTAINVGLIVTTAPIFTSIISFVFGKENINIKKIFFGFGLVVLGLIVMYYNKVTPFKIGDILAIIGAICFGLYSFLVGKIHKKFDGILIIRKTLFWGLMLLFIYAVFHKTSFHTISYINYTILLNLLFLSIIASGLCFLMWRWSISIIGANKTSNYIYLVPLINSIASNIFLNELINIHIIIASILIIGGLYFSQK